MENHDVIVVGAGPSGSSTAYFLAQHHLDVLLLDKSQFPRDKTCGDGLPPRALPILYEMGVLDEVQKAGYRLDRLSVTSPTGITSITAIPLLPHAPSYALTLPRFQFDQLLLQRTRQSGALFLGGVHVRRFEIDDQGVTVNTDKGDYRATMLVIATGAATGLLTRTGLLSKPPQTMVAARAYFEGITNLPTRFQFYFSGVTLPGYGWVFPTSETSANVGTGYVVSRDKGRQPSSPRAAFDTFVHDQSVHQVLRDAKQVSAVKTYPVRTDFTRAVTFGKRVLLVGEAIGLVNPLTGDGIDYALESGKIAAQHIVDMMASSDYSRERHQSYDADLRERYQELFLYCELIRRTCLNMTTLNALVPMAAWFPVATEQLVATVLGGRPVIDLSFPLRFASSLMPRF